MKCIRLFSILLSMLILASAGPGRAAGSKSAMDSFTGRGTPGPFVLTYKDIAANSEMVFLNGNHQTRGIDYVIEYGSGIIAFNKPIMMGQKASVSYQYDPSTGTRFTSSAPMGFNLVNKENSNFQLTMSQKVAQEGMLQVTALGMQGNITRGSTAVQSMFLMDPTVRGDGKSKGSDFNTRSAAKLNSNFNVGGLAITGNYLHVGENFQDAKAYNLQEGVDARSLIAKFDKVAGLNLQFSDSRNEVLAGKEKGKVTTANEMSMDYKLGSNSKLNALRQKNETQNGGHVATTTLERMGLNQSFGKNLNFNVTNEKRTAKGTDKDDEVTTQSFSLDGSKYLTRMGFTASHVITDSQKNGQVAVSTLGLNSALSKTTSATLGFVNTDSEHGGHTARTSLGMNSTLNPLTTMSLGFIDNQSELGGHDTQATLGMKTTMAGMSFNASHVANTSEKNGDLNVTDVAISGGKAPLAVSAALNETAREQGNDVQTAKVNVSSATKVATVKVGMTQVDTENVGAVTDSNLNLNMKKGDVSVSTDVARKDMENQGSEMKINTALGTWNDRLKLTAGLVRNDYQTQADYATSSYGMEMAPIKPLKLNASFLQRQVGSASKDGFQAGMMLRLGDKNAPKATASSFEFFNTGIDLNPGERLALQGNVLQEPTDDEARTTEGRLKVRPIDGLTLSGLYKNRERNNADDQQTLVAAVSVAPIKELELVGNYETNPEQTKDNKTVVNPITRRLVGLRTNLGSLGLTGKYGSTQDLLSGQTAQVRQYGLDLKLWKTTSLTAGLTQDDPMNGPTQNTYTLDFKRDLGESFSLALGAKVIAKDETQSQDVSASLKAGIRF